MPQYYPVVVQAGHSVMGTSLGFHAYSLRIDNLTNQWLLEESSLAWVPPYSLGMCLRLYGTSVGLIVNQAPPGQPQLAPIVGEQTVGVYSDQYRTEVAGTAVRQFTLVQAVSDLTEGAQPALPPVSVDRLWADNQGNIHHLHSDGTDRTLIDPSNVNLIQSQILAYAATAPLGGDLYGTVSNGHIEVKSGNTLSVDSGAQLVVASGAQALATQWTISNGGYTFLSDQHLLLYAGRSGIHDDGTGIIVADCAAFSVMNDAETAYVNIRAAGISNPGVAGINFPSSAGPTDSVSGQLLMKRTDAAGGDLTGTYPNPTVYPVMGTWTPMPYQGNAIPNTSTGVYWKLGRLVIVIFNCGLTGAGVGGYALGLQGFPFPSAGISNSTNVVSGMMQYLNSGTAFYAGDPCFMNTSTMQFMAHNNANWMGLTPAFTAKNGDNMGGFLVYETT